MPNRNTRGINKVDAWEVQYKGYNITIGGAAGMDTERVHLIQHNVMEILPE